MGFILWQYFDCSLHPDCPRAHPSQHSLSHFRLPSRPAPPCPHPHTFFSIRTNARAQIYVRARRSTDTRGTSSRRALAPGKSCRIRGRTNMRSRSAAPRPSAAPSAAALPRAGTPMNPTSRAKAHRPRRGSGPDGEWPYRASTPRIAAAPSARGERRSRGCGPVG